MKRQKIKDKNEKFKIYKKINKKSKKERGMIIMNKKGNIMAVGFNPWFALGVAAAVIAVILLVRWCSSQQQEPVITPPEQRQLDNCGLGLLRWCGACTEIDKVTVLKIGPVQDLCSKLSDELGFNCKDFKYGECHVDQQEDVVYFNSDNKQDTKEGTIYCNQKGKETISETEVKEDDACDQDGFEVKIILCDPKSNVECKGEKEIDLGDIKAKFDPDNKELYINVRSIGDDYDIDCLRVVDVETGKCNINEYLLVAAANCNENCDANAICSPVESERGICKGHSCIPNGRLEEEKGEDCDPGIKCLPLRFNDTNKNGEIDNFKEITLKPGFPQVYWCKSNESDETIDLEEFSLSSQGCYSIYCEDKNANFVIDGDESIGLYCKSVKALFKTPSGEIKNEDEVTCQDYDYTYPKKGVRCTSECKVDLSRCRDPSIGKCGNGQIDYSGNYLEVCELSSETVIDPYTLEEEKKIIINEDYFEYINEHRNEYNVSINESKPSCYFTQLKLDGNWQSPFYGDASRLKCENCILNFTDCHPKEQMPKKESDVEGGCSNGLNDDWWFDFSGDPSSYIETGGYINFNKHGYDTSKCFDSSIKGCYDCYDLDCDGKQGPEINGTVGICNFKHERDCNDNYDNDFDGKADAQDDDCKSGMYNPLYSQTGNCNKEYNCYYDKTKCLKNDQKIRSYICYNDDWTNTGRLLASMLMGISSDRKEVMCSYYPEYILSDETLLSDVQINRRKYDIFCVAHYPKKGGVLGITLNLDTIDDLHEVLAALGKDAGICDPVWKGVVRSDNNYQLMLCADNVYYNNLTQTIVVTNGSISLGALNNENNVKDKALLIKGNVNINDDLFRNYFETANHMSALHYAVNGSVEVFGIIDSLGSTTYITRYFKNVNNFDDNFDEICEKLPNCKKQGNIYVTYETQSTTDINSLKSTIENFMKYSKGLNVLYFPQD